MQMRSQPEIPLSAGPHEMFTLLNVYPVKRGAMFNQGRAMFNQGRAMFNQGKAYLTGACPARPVAPEDGTGVKFCYVYPVKFRRTIYLGQTPTGDLTGVSRASMGAGGE